jgi:superfamily II DNA helicase RecQ
LLISDGVVEEFGGAQTPARTKKTKATAKTGSSMPTATKTADEMPIKLTAAGEALAARLKEWRAAEAKRLRVPAYVVLHDRTLSAIADQRPSNLRQLLEINGMGPAKAERFGAAILELCGTAQ